MVGGNVGTVKALEKRIHQLRRELLQARLELIDADPCCEGVAWCVYAREVVTWLRGLRPNQPDEWLPECTERCQEIRRLKAQMHT